DFILEHGLCRRTPLSARIAQAAAENCPLAKRIMATVLTDRAAAKSAARPTRKPEVAPAALTPNQVRMAEASRLAHARLEADIRAGKVQFNTRYDVERPAVYRTEAPYYAR